MLIELSALDCGGAVNSLALDAAGRLAAAAVDEERVAVYRVDGDGLAPVAGWPLDLGRYRDPWVETIRPGDTSLAFLDERTLLAVRTIYRWPGEGEEAPAPQFLTSLAAVDAESGTYRREWIGRRPGLLPAGPPLPFGPGLIALNLGETGVVLDASTFAERAWLRELDEEGVPLDPDDELGDAQIASEGFLFEPATCLLRVLWRRFAESILDAWRIDPSGGPAVRTDRRTLFLEPPGVALDGSALCEAPGGAGLAAWATAGDDWLAWDDPRPPAFARLGRLAIIDAGGVRAHDVASEFARDFTSFAQARPDAKGGLTRAGYRFSAQSHAARVFAIDDRRIAVVTPSGLLLGVDVEDGRPQRLFDFGGPLADLRFHPARGLVVAAGEDGTIRLLRR